MGGGAFVGLPAVSPPPKKIKICPVTTKATPQRVAFLSGFASTGRVRLRRMDRYRWMAAPSAASAASITPSFIVGWAWIVRAI